VAGRGNGEGCVAKVYRQALALTGTLLLLRTLATHYTQPYLR
jgi:hypothetical protein